MLYLIVGLGLIVCASCIVYLIHDLGGECTTNESDLPLYRKG